MKLSNTSLGRDKIKPGPHLPTYLDTSLPMKLNDNKVNGISRLIIEFKNWAIPGLLFLFFVLFKKITDKNCRLQRDSNSDG